MPARAHVNRASRELEFEKYRTVLDSSVTVRTQRISFSFIAWRPNEQIATIFMKNWYRSDAFYYCFGSVSPTLELSFIDDDWCVCVWVISFFFFFVLFSLVVQLVMKISIEMWAHVRHGRIENDKIKLVAANKYLPVCPLFVIVVWFGCTSKPLSVSGGRCRCFTVNELILIGLWCFP